MTIIIFFIRQNTDINKRKNELIAYINDRIPNDTEILSYIDRLIPLYINGTDVQTYTSSNTKIDGATGRLRDYSYDAMIDCIEEIQRIYGGTKMYFDLAGLSRIQCAATGSMAQFLNIDMIDSSESNDIITNNTEFLKLNGTAKYVVDYLYECLPEKRTAYEISLALEKKYPGKTNDNTVRQTIAKLTRHNMLESITYNSVNAGRPFRKHRLNHNGKLAYYINRSE